MSWLEHRRKETHLQEQKEMKLSVSAYRAQASAHKKILSNYQQQLSYGATNQASSSRTPSDPAAVLSGLKVSVSFHFFFFIIIPLFSFPFIILYLLFLTLTCNDSETHKTGLR